jgi:hypothetical protein
MEMKRRNFMGLLTIPFVMAIVNCTHKPEAPKQWYHCGKFHRQDGPMAFNSSLTFWNKQS